MLDHHLVRHIQFFLHIVREHASAKKFLGEISIRLAPPFSLAVDHHGAVLSLPLFVIDKAVHTTLPALTDNVSLNITLV